MLHTLLARTVGLFRGVSRDDESADGGRSRRDGPDRVRDAAASRQRPAGAPATDGGGPSTSLYRCPACDRTYVSDSMTSCSKCDGEVDRVPNEVELGLVGD